MGIGVVIPAAGIGKRMNSTIPKQFLELSGKPILIHTLEVFQQHILIDEITVVTNEASFSQVKLFVERYELNKVKQIVIGGKERQDSVYVGVVATNTDWIMVHDAVRAFITPEEISRLVEAGKGNHQAVTLAVPVKDTIKKVNRNGVVEETLKRDQLWSIQTPQLIHRALLLHAHEQASKQHVNATDDAMLIELLGEPVHVVEGEYTNIKVTTPDDIYLGEAILAKRQKGSV
ncbi:2-C-methyl-D-erythritol 4-phosphate cytidylyltransferase [Shimazuella alba]